MFYSSLYEYVEAFTDWKEHHGVYSQTDRLSRTMLFCEIESSFVTDDSEIWNIFYLLSNKKIRVTNGVAIVVRLKKLLEDIR